MSKKIKIEKGKPKRRENLLKCSDSAEEISKIKGASIEITGNEIINIDGCTGVTEYRAEYLNLKIIGGALIICGENFDITYFENKVITVKGKISSLEFGV